jgi:hypothetical protein
VPVGAAIYLLLGYPGTGKFTVAGEIVRQLRAAGRQTKLLDNHAVSDLIFPLVPQADGKSPLPAELIDRVRELNNVVLTTIEQLSPPQWSFVFTHHLIDNDANRRYVARLQRLAELRGAVFVPVTLWCESTALLHRVVQPERHGRKLVDPDRALDYLLDDVIVPPSPLALRLDITRLSPADAASTIIEHGASAPSSEPPATGPDRSPRDTSHSPDLPTETTPA